MERRVWALCCLLLVCNPLLNAQSRFSYLPQPKVLAKMMLEEKEAGQLDDAPYVAYFVDSLGLVKDGMVFTKGENAILEVTLSSQVDESRGSILRDIHIQCTNHTLIWRIVVGLKELGLKEVEKDGAYIELKGKGLFAATGQGSGHFAGRGPHSITLGCRFDKKD